MVEKGYNLIEAAELLGVKVITMRRWAQTGKVKANKIPGTNRWVILESEIRRLQGNDKEGDN
jgi:excisionase family DNA binding protein